MPYGKLYLLPVFLGDEDPGRLSAQLVSRAAGLTDFVVENEKTARAFLKKIGTRIPQQELKLQVLDEHTPAGEIPDLLAPLLEGRDIGLMSEAGCPGIADPGSELVRLAHHKGITVVPHSGPSSILLGLMGSGLNGQRFRFLGYLPREKNARRSAIKDLEKEIRRSGETQIFIETPYRNDALLEDLLSVLSPEIYLCIGCGLDSEDSFLLTRQVAGWRKQPPATGKKPCIFLAGTERPARP
jgi:16S rRNA (cytidine1402-2'-O)-methyltransferase